MNVLIVDDQPQVVSGLIKGISWKRCNIEHVFKAYNTIDARSIFMQQSIDILLCDIEMPGECGLDLIEWIEEQRFDTKCILLTAHADFNYAQKAIQLDIYDYIVQPAPYRKIESVIYSANMELNQQREEQKYNSYGHLFYEHKDHLLDSLLSDWFTGNFFDFSIIASDLLQLMPHALPFDSDTPMLCCIFRFLSVDVSMKNRSVILNSTFFSEPRFRDLHYFQYSPDNETFHVAIRCDSISQSEIRSLITQIRVLPNTFMTDFDCRFLCSCADWPVPAAQISDCFETLSETNSSARQRSTASRNYGFSNLYDSCLSIRQMLDSISARQHPDPDTLHEYCAKLKEIAAIAEQYCSMPAALRTCIARLSNTSTDLTSIISFTDQMLEFIGKYCGEPGNTQSQIDLILRYIHNNIETDLRRNDIAAAVYMSPGHISRIFRENLGTSLKEYIIEEKMKLAHTLLHNTSLPISVIASRVGYSNFSYFSQTYKKVWGISPSNERES